MGHRRHRVPVPARRWWVVVVAVAAGGGLLPSGASSAQTAPDDRVYRSVAEVVSWGRVDPRVAEAVAAGGGVRAIVVQRAPSTVGYAASAAGGGEAGVTLARSFAPAKEEIAGIAGVSVVSELPSLNVTPVRIDSAASLIALGNSDVVEKVVLDEEFRATVAQSSVVIRSPETWARGYGGAGTYVGVIDTGVNYTTPDLACTAPGVPASCPVAIVPPDFSRNANGTPYDDGSLDSSGHGTNVSSIIARIAPQTKLVVADVFGPSGSAYASDIAAAVQYFINLKSSGVPIRAVNLSLGSTAFESGSCADITGMGALLAAGIQPVAAAGNSAFAAGSPAFRQGLSSPACVPGVISVGATYDMAVGAISYPNACIDYTTSLDKIPCFSQSGPNLSVLAPGAVITAGGLIVAGTSQAAPHVTAAVAILASAVPTASSSALNAAVRTSPVQIFDPRVGLTFPRLDLPSALDALQSASGATTPDSFDRARVIAGASGSTSVAAGLTSQGGETSHGNRNGIRSTWFSWTAPSTGTATFSSVGSTFDTALSVYSGTMLGALTEVAADDNTTSTGTAAMVGPIEVVSGTTYRIAVNCGTDLASCGTVSLAWSASTSTSAPVNDALSSAVLLSASSGSTGGVNAFATSQEGEPGAIAGAPASKSIWFKIPGRPRQRLSLSTDGSNFDTAITVLAGSDVRRLFPLGAHNDVGPTANGFDSTSRFEAASLSEGESYYVAVDSPTARTGSVVLAWSFLSGAAPSAGGGPTIPRTGAPQTPGSIPSTTRPAAPGTPPVSIAVPCLERIPTGPSYVILDSAPGDYIGQGACTIYSIPTSWIASNGPGVMSILGADGSIWTLVFGPASGQPFAVGVYPDARNDSGGSKPVMFVRGAGRGCSEAFGSFTVTTVVFDQVANVSDLDLSFEQRCEQAGAPPLRGVIRIRPYSLPAAGACFSALPMTGPVFVMDSRAVPNVDASAYCESTIGDPSWSFSASGGPSEVTILATRNEFPNYMSLELATGSQASLGVGTFQAKGFPDNGSSPGLRVGGHNFSEFAGNFTINSISFSVDGQVTAVDVSFFQNMGWLNPPRVGRVRF